MSIASLSPSGTDCGNPSPLMMSGEGAHYGVVDLINLGADIHCCDNYGFTALHYASLQGSVEMVQYLMNKGHALDMKNSYGKTPLMLASKWSQIEVIDFLINSGADIHCSDDDGWTVLHHASSKGWLDIVQCLVNKGVALDVNDTEGVTPLKLAAEQSHTEVVKLLINSGADIHCFDDGWTVLHHASCIGWLEIVQCLVDKGVIDVKDTEGETPLEVAVAGSHRDIVELLINSGANIQFCDDSFNGCSVLHYASYKGWLEIVQCIVNKGVAIDVKDANGLTPLKLAAEQSHKEVVELLINSGADIHSCDNEGSTVLHEASYKGWFEIVRSLRDREISLEVKNSDGVTPLMGAAGGSQREVVELLIKLGADIHCFDDVGLTVLHHALYQSDVRMLNLVLQEGVDINAQNSRGDTPLHLAIILDKIEFVDYLLKAGADCNLENNNGRSPFNMLIEYKMHAETIRLCIEKGAKVKSTDYHTILEDPFLKKVILQDIKFCSQTIIDKFDNKDLPLLYKGLTSAQKLPHIDKMKIGNRSGMTLQVQQAVTHEIQAKGFCNLFQMVPIVLSILCVKSSIEYLQANPSESQNGLKRLRPSDEQEYPCKKNM